MSIEKLSELQKQLTDAENEYQKNPTFDNFNNLVIKRDEVEIYLNMNKDNKKHWSI